MSRVAIVGAGCGRGMLTLRGLQLLQACDCVVYDSLLDEELLSHTGQGCVKLFAGKRAGSHSLAQEEINALLLSCAQKYELTVRLKGGDPCVFGRGGEEMQALLQAGVAAEFVPGVTSAVAAAEFAGIPVTHRGVARGFYVVTAHTRDERPDFSALARIRDTLVFLMAKGTAGHIMRGLLEGGMPANTPVALVSEGGMPAMQVRRCKLCELEQNALPMPAPLTIYVGMVCAEDFIEKCGHGAKVVVTGTASHIGRARAALTELGIACAAYPVLLTQPRAFDYVFDLLAGAKLLVFTSPNGVDVFFDRARELGIDLRTFARHRFAVIGARTGEALRERGFCADYMPQQFTSKALAACISQLGLAREEVLLLRAGVENALLEGVGVQVSLYDSVVQEEALAAARRAVCGARFVTFGSAAGARAVLEGVSLPAGCTPVCLGGETERELKARGYAPLTSATADAAALARAIWEELQCND